MFTRRLDISWVATISGLDGEAASDDPKSGQARWKLRSLLAAAVVFSHFSTYNLLLVVFCQ